MPDYFGRQAQILLPNDITRWRIQAYRVVKFDSLMRLLTYENFQVRVDPSYIPSLREVVKLKFNLLSGSRQSLFGEF